MLSHEESTDLLDTTMAALQADLPTLVPQSGKGILDEWIFQLSQGENTMEVVNGLETLKTQLEASTDPKTIELTLGQLADHTVEISATLGAEGDMATRLTALASALRTLAGQLGNA